MKRTTLALQLSLLLAAGTPATARATIYGTMSNFDVYNETETEVHGAEIELEGIHKEDLSRTFPSHFSSKLITDYIEGAKFGTRITYSGYNFNGASLLAPTIGQSTNGHSCVNTPGCEHFGFSTVGIQPTAARYYWLDQNGNRVGNAPMQVPTPTWTYVPPANPGAAPAMRAEIEPVEIEEQRPDSVWMKVFKTELERPVELAELMSANGIVPEDEIETETEWELLEGGKMNRAEDDIPDGKKSILRRYEYYEYVGAYDDEHEPLSTWNDMGDPPAAELGQFIAANMVAANLFAPDRTFGDYNDDGEVDAADYVLWRHLHGSDIVADADGDDNGMIDDEDYGVWKKGYGHVLDDNAAAVNPAAAAGAAIPEPTACGLALLAMGVVVANGRWRRRA